MLFYQNVIKSSWLLINFIRQAIEWSLWVLDHTVRSIMTAKEFITVKIFVEDDKYCFAIAWTWTNVAIPISPRDVDVQWCRSIQNITGRSQCVARSDALLLLKHFKCISGLVKFMNIIRQRLHSSRSIFEVRICTFRELNRLIESKYWSNSLFTSFWLKLYTLTS